MKSYLLVSKKLGELDLIFWVEKVKAFQSESGGQAKRLNTFKRNAAKYYNIPLDDLRLEVFDE